MGLLTEKPKSKLVNASKLQNQPAKDNQSQTATEAFKLGPITQFPLSASALSPDSFQGSAPNHLWFGSHLIGMDLGSINADIFQAASVYPLAILDTCA